MALPLLLSLLALLTPLLTATLGVLLAALILAVLLSVLIACRERGLGQGQDDSDDSQDHGRVTDDPRGATPVVQAALTLSERLTVLSGGLDLADLASLKARAVSQSRPVTDAEPQTRRDHHHDDSGAPDDLSRSAARAPHQAGRAGRGAERPRVLAVVHAAGVTRPVVHGDDATWHFGRDDATRFLEPENHTGHDDGGEGDQTRFLIPAPPPGAKLDDADGERGACDVGVLGHPTALPSHPIQRGPSRRLPRDLLETIRMWEVAPTCCGRCPPRAPFRP